MTTIEKLLTTEEVARSYGVTPYTVTQNWCNKGLKFLRGKNTFLFKEKWVDNFLEEQSETESKNRNVKNFKMVVNKTVKTNVKRNFNKEMKII